MKSRFDPYDSEIRNCWCPLCVALARAGQSHLPSRVNAASDDLFEALELGQHTKRGPKARLIKGFDARKYRDDGSDMREGLGIGVTLGGVTGSVRRG